MMHPVDFGWDGYGTFSETENTWQALQQVRTGQQFLVRYSTVGGGGIENDPDLAGLVRIRDCVVG